MRAMHRGCIYKGSDVRVSTGQLYDPTVWPRISVDARLWKWKVAVSYNLNAGHINLNEAYAYLVALKWRLKDVLNVGTRMVHMVDSYVTLAVVVKGRSTSAKLQHILRRMNALTLAGSMVPAVAYVRTDLNPADAPSRWRR